MTTFAITGATGQLGQFAVKHLKQYATPTNIIALVRNAEKAANLGVTVREADYTQPEKLTTALQGVDKLLLISSNAIGQRVAHHSNVLNAAKAAGVKHVIYTSLLRADTSPLNLAAEHVETEKLLKASGITYTILRNGWYTENYTASITAAVANGAFYGCAKEGKIASASREDFAEAAVNVLVGIGHENRTYELAGDTAYTLAELTAEISRQTDNALPYVDLPENDYAAALAQAGLPADFAAMIASWDVGASNGALFSEDKTLSTLLKRATTPLATSVKAVL